MSRISVAVIATAQMENGTSFQTVTTKQPVAGSAATATAAAAVHRPGTRRPRIAVASDARAAAAATACPRVSSARSPVSFNDDQTRPS